MLIEIAQNWHVKFLGVVGFRNKGNLYQSRFYGFDKAKVTHYPREKFVWKVSRTFQIVRRCRKIVHLLKFVAFCNFSNPGEPDGSFGIFIRLFVVLCFAFRFWQIAVMSLVIHNQQPTACLEAAKQPFEEHIEILFCLLFLA